jgi:arylsulfatase A-like enzyme
MLGSLGPRYVFTESGYQMDYTLSVREGNWKLIHVPNPVDRSLMTGSEYELYDLESDPGETRNLVEERPQVVEGLKRVLKEWSEPWIEAAYRNPGSAREILDEEVLERLRALGYIE